MTSTVGERQAAAGAVVDDASGVGRIRRLNDLGFDVGELIVEHQASGDRSG